MRLEVKFMNNPFLIKPKALEGDQAVAAEVSRHPTRRVFAKNLGGATIATVLSWNLADTAKAAGPSICELSVQGSPAASYTDYPHSDWGYTAKAELNLWTPGPPTGAKAIQIRGEAWRNSDYYGTVKNWTVGLLLGWIEIEECIFDSSFPSGPGTAGALTEVHIEDALTGFYQYPPWPLAAAGYMRDVYQYYGEIEITGSDGTSGSNHVVEGKARVYRKKYVKIYNLSYVHQSSTSPVRQAASATEASFSAVIYEI